MQIEFVDCVAGSPFVCCVDRNRGCEVTVPHATCRLDVYMHLNSVIFDFIDDTRVAP